MARRKRNEAVDVPVGVSRARVERRMAQGLTREEAIREQLDRPTAKERVTQDFVERMSRHSHLGA